MGVVSRDLLLQEAATNTDEQYISGIMERAFSVVSPDERVIDFLNRASQDEEGPVLVTANGHLLGMVYREKLFEFLYLHGIRRARAEQQSKDEKQDFGIQ
jgi:predicted transcriptional regulator